MSTPHPPQTSEEVRQQILEAAENRFRHYGYGKTTMAELAEDVKMSAANLYRYFKNKQDIAVACAQRCHCERADALREVMRRPGRSAAERLEEFALALFNATYDEANNNSKINELIETVAREHADIVHTKIEGEQSLIAEILAQGNAGGEFDVADVIETARYVHTALVVFAVPLFHSLYPRDKFETMAKGVVALLVKGLAKR